MGTASNGNQIQMSIVYNKSLGAGHFSKSGRYEFTQHFQKCRSYTLFQDLSSAQTKECCFFFYVIDPCLMLLNLTCRIKKQLGGCLWIDDASIGLDTC